MRPLSHRAPDCVRSDHRARPRGYRRLRCSIRSHLTGVPISRSFTGRRWPGGRAGTTHPTERVNLNPPAIVVAFAPLTDLSRQTAQTVFTLVGIACVFLACRRITRAIPRVPWLLLASIVLALDGGWTNLWLGQEGLVLMPIVTAAWLDDRDNRERSCWPVGGPRHLRETVSCRLDRLWAWRRKWHQISSALASG